MYLIASSTGPEVVAEAKKVLDTISASSKDVKIHLETHDFGGCAIDAHGDPLPAATLKACQEADAILLGASLSSIPSEKISVMLMELV